MDTAHTDTSPDRRGTRGPLPGTLPVIGAQISTAGGFLPVPGRAKDIGAEVAQVFNSNPRVWKPRVPAPGEMEAFAAALRVHGLRLVVHSIYLINLASPDQQLRRRSAEALAGALAVGALAGAEAVVTHVGSHRGEPAKAERRVVATIARATTEAARAVAKAGRASGAAGPMGVAPWPALLLENGAGGGNTLGGRLEELQALLSLEEAAGLEIDLPLGICLDTAHLFAAGYAVHEVEGLEQFIEDLGRLDLLERIRLVHLNDSKTAFSSRHDQHANPGEGLIGYEALARVVRHPALRRIPFVLEGPGIDGRGPDAASVAVAKSMRMPTSGDGGPSAR